MEQERKRLIDSTSGLDRMMLSLLFESRLRVEDLVNLRVADVDLDKGSVRISPLKSIKLSPRVLEELRSYSTARPDQVYLFEGRCGKPVTCKWKRCVLEKIMRRDRG